MPDITGKRILITAGPTQEPIDPVRYIGNRSTGKMGITLAEAALSHGAEVILICGPSNVSCSESINRVDVLTAQEMFDKTMQYQSKQDILILAAAVADYRPKNVADKKIKKKDSSLVIELEPTPDILDSLGQMKRGDQTLVGFALETNNEVENAFDKLQRKNCDMIVLNSLKDDGAGFGYDTNRIQILDRHNNISTFELKSKAEVANDILHAIKDYK